MSENMLDALRLMGYGLSGVFITLALFIILIIALVKSFPDKDEKNKTGE